MAQCYNYKNMKNKKIITVIFILIFTLIININITKADPEEPESMTKLKTFAETDVGLGQYKDPADITMNIINVVLGFIGLILLIMIIYSGYQWMTSGGNDEIIGKAKKRLTNAIIGVFIVLASYAIAYTIMEIIQKDPNQTWWNP